MEAVSQHIMIAARFTSTSMTKEAALDHAQTQPIYKLQT
jgi:hypothetical protein